MMKIELVGGPVDGATIAVLAVDMMLGHIKVQCPVQPISDMPWPPDEDCLNAAVRFYVLNYDIEPNTGKALFVGYEKERIL